MLDLVFLGILSDFQFVIQIFIMVSIISFVLNHLGKGALSIIIILLMFYVVFIMLPALSEAVFILYTLLMIGVSSLLVDFFFITAGSGGQQQQQGEERPDVIGQDVQARKEGIEKAHHAGKQSMNMLAMMMRRGGR
jgi:hypothetical protein